MLNFLNKRFKKSKQIVYYPFNMTGRHFKKALFSTDLTNGLHR